MEEKLKKSNVEVEVISHEERAIGDVDIVTSKPSTETPILENKERSKLKSKRFKSPRTSHTSSNGRGSIFSDVEFTEMKKKKKKKRKSKVNMKRKSKPAIEKTAKETVSRGPIIIENNLNRFTTYSYNDWKEILKYERKENLSNSILVNSLRRGIPLELRPRIWAFLASLNEKLKKDRSINYDRLIASKSKDDGQIRLDIVRTNVGEFDRDEEEKEKILGVIFNVLRAYSNYDPKTGYVQGMNHIVAALAYNLHPSKYKNIKFSFGSKLQDYEETIFYIMVYIMQELNWRDAYLHKFLKLKVLIAAFENRLEQNHTDLYYHMIDYRASMDPENDDLFSLIFPHFQSILLQDIPIIYSGRIIDIFLVEGEKLILDIYQRFYYLSTSDIMRLTDGADIWCYIRDSMIKDLFKKRKNNLQELFPFNLTQKILE